MRGVDALRQSPTAFWSAYSLLRLKSGIEDFYSVVIKVTK